MKTSIEGGWVVAWSGTRHEVHERGAVVYEGDRVIHAGGPYAGAVDARVSARREARVARASSTRTCTRRATAATGCSATW